MVLTACILTQNNEDTIYNTLNSINTLCDEIVVIDCLSEDKTRTIAKDFTDKIYTIEFCNDYSIVRNIGIENSTGDYILVLNGDEIVDSHSLMELKDYLEVNPTCFGAYFKEYDILNNEVVYSTLSFRVFRNSERFKFQGRLNEQIVPSIKKCVTSTSLLVGEYTLYRNHDTISPSSSQYKLSTHKKILDSYLEEEKDWFYYKSIGDISFYEGNYNKSIQNYEASLDLECFPFDIYMDAPNLILKLIISHIKLNKFNEGYSIYSLYGDKFLDFRELHFSGFICSYYMKKYSIASMIYDKFQSCSNYDIFYPLCTLENSYNLNLLKYELDINCYLEEHPELIDLSNLIVGIICNGNTFNNEDLLFKLNKISCDKIILTPFYLNNQTYLMDKFNVSLCKFDLENKNVNMLNYFLSQLSYKIKGDKNTWVLMMYENEGITMDSLSNIFSTIKNSENIYGASTKIISHSGKKSDEIRLFKYSENLFYDDKTLSSLEYSFNGEYGHKKYKSINLFQEN